MTVQRLTADPWLQLGLELGEGPAWDSRTGRLSFVDIPTGQLFRVVGDTVETVVQVEVPLGAALPAADGGFLLVTREGFRVLSDAGEVTPLLAVLDDRPDLRFNDAKADPSGRCWAGTLSLRAEPLQGALFRLDDGPTASVRHAPVGLSNGLGWSPAGDVLYFADTDADTVFAFDHDVATGDTGPAREFARVTTPDGLCVDDAGAVWVARWDGGVVERYTPAGDLDTVLDLPVPHATSCAFTPDGLVVTTGRGTRPDGSPAGPHAGDVFVADVGVGGPPVTPWQPVGTT